MGYPTFKALEFSGSSKPSNVVLQKGIVTPYSPERLQLLQNRTLTRGGSPYVTQWSDKPVRFLDVSIRDISESNRQNLYEFFEAIGYSLNNFHFFPKGIETTQYGEGIFAEGGIFGSLFNKTTVLDDEQFLARLWQDSLNMPIVRASGFSNIDNLTLLIEKEIS